MFSDNLEKILQQKNISTYKMCKETEITQSTVSGWKQGKMPSIEKLITIAKYLKVSADELLGIESPNYNITSEELYLIQSFREVSPEVQKIVINTLEISKPNTDELTCTRIG